MALKLERQNLIINTTVLFSILLLLCFPCRADNTSATEAHPDFEGTTLDADLSEPEYIVDSESSELELTGNEGWYQIDVVIFQQSAIANSSEITRPEQRLSYPYKWNLLKTSEQLIEEKQQHELDLIAAEEQRLRFLEGDAGASPEGEVTADGQPGEPISFQSEFESATESETDPESEVVSDSEEPIVYEVKQPYSFLLLPKELSTFSELSPYLRWSKNFNILASLSWQQLVLDKDRSIAAAISVGDQFDSHQQIEGTILVHVARYLHAEINLWKADFVRNYGQDVDSVALPVNPYFESEQPAFSEDFIEPELSQPWLQEESAWDQSLFNSPESDGLNSDYESVLQDDFVAHSVKTLRAQRKMRSRERHYIDHPDFGLLIQITPIELEEEAVAEGSDGLPSTE